MGKTQFGFKNWMGTRAALFAKNVLIQRCRDVNVGLHLRFIDYEKNFDRLRHSKLMEILRIKVLMVKL